ncbi:glycosyltransferase family 2 protein [Caldifermentibacillus hisashii]|uniref:glycosyltransferase family 2 protein n=1 Tax=Caldifermentibacillus hisashii TaxID=996558 RepID=UPI0031FCE726
MIKEPFVSIITPSYNSAVTIKDTINSVKQQSYQNWEMIIIDDNSSDSTLNIVKREQEMDNRIRIIPLKENVGAAKARNIGIENAKGTYIAFLDSDDLWVSNKLKEQIQLMENKGYLFTYSSYAHIDKDGNPLNEIINAVDKIDYKEMLRRKGTIGTLTVVLNRDKIDTEISMPDIKTSEDFALWLRILKSGVTAYGIPKVLAYYRIASGQISGNKIKAAQRVWYVYRGIEKLNIVQSTWYFINYMKYGIVKTFFNKNKQ